MAQLFQQGTYLNNPQGPTIPLVEHNTSLDKLRDNPRMPADQMYPKILEYLTLAETYLSDYTPTGISDISLNAVHGQMARVYLITGQWPKAEEYAKKAQTGREALTEAQWKDKQNGFNNPTSQKSWIWCLTYTSDDDAVKGQLYNWMNQMSTETNMDSYSHWDSNVKMIDAHLYSQIPTTDWRRESWVSPTNEYPVNSDSPVKDKIPAYTNIKFRPGQGNYTDYLVAHAISIPLMRMEEMMLIEAEAAGRQTLANGIMLLETFGKLRNPADTIKATKPSD